MFFSKARLMLKCPNWTMAQSWLILSAKLIPGLPVAQLVEHGTSNAKIMGSIPRESKSW